MGYMKKNIVAPSVIQLNLSFEKLNVVIPSVIFVSIVVVTFPLIPIGLIVNQF